MQQYVATVNLTLTPFIGTFRLRRRHLLQIYPAELPWIDTTIIRWRTSRLHKKGEKLALTEKRTRSFAFSFDLGTLPNKSKASRVTGGLHVTEWRVCDVIWWRIT